MLVERASVYSADEPFVSLIYDGNIDALVSCTYSKDTLTRTGQIRILDKLTLEDLFAVRLTSAAFHLEFVEEANLYVTGLGDGQIALFDAQTRQLSLDKPQPFSGQMVTDAKLDGDGRRVVFTDEAGALRIY